MMAVSQFRPSPTTWRRPGCDERCQRITVLVIGEDYVRAIEAHDPSAHEDYVREAMGGAIPTRYRGSYQFGGNLLCVDLREGSVTVKGMPVDDLTAKEWAMLSYLVSNANRVVTHAELLQVCWGDEYVTMQPGGIGTSEHHLIRVNMARLRKKLWEAGALIQTVVGRGHRMLRDLPA